MCYDSLELQTSDKGTIVKDCTCTSDYIYTCIHVCLYMYNLQCTISSTFTIIINISGMYMYLWLWQLMINCNGIHDEQVLMQLADSSKYYILY